MKHGKHLRKKENRVGRSVWHRCLAVLLSAAMLAGVMIPSAAGAGLGANVEFSAKIVKDTGDTAEAIQSVDSGDSFFLALDYKFSSSPDGVSYGGAAIAIQLPEYVKVDLAGSVVTSDFKQPEVAEVTLPGGQVIQRVTIPCQDRIDQGRAGIIYLKCYFENMVTPDQTVGSFNSILFTGTLTDGSGNTEKLDQRIDPVSITSMADQQWNIQKTVTDPAPAGEEIPVVTKQDGYYYVTYQIAVTDPVENMNRYGRLNCEEFSVTDTLPAADRENGGAQLVSVGYLDRSSQFQPLAEGDGYTKESNADGSLKSLTFQYVNKFDQSMVTEGQVRVPNGSLLPTTYQVTVKFDAAAYQIPTNVPFVRAVLDNQAQVSYKPLAKDAVVKDSSAKVQVGDVEDKTTPVELIVEKTLTIQGDGLAVSDNTFVLNGEKQAVYGSAQFTLYSDPECTQVAKDIDGSEEAGAGRLLDGTGRVKFSNLRYGTYYLKETQTPDGFTGVGEAIQVTLNQDGTVTAGGKTLQKGEALTVDNTTDENGPGYAAFWKKGMGSGENTEKFLPGVSFRLTNNADASKVYTAVSGSDGLVLFEGIPAGEYTLQETGVPEGGEYEVSDKTYTVTVKGNQVNYPDGLQKDGNKPYILNQSEKGILKITKVDSTDRGVTLPDAEFALYGPYTSESAVPENPDEGDLAAELITGADGTAASEPLETGWYLLRETKAPDTYAIMQRDTRVQITSNHTEALQIENAQRGALQIIKYGQLTLGSVATESRVPLAGAVFGVYTDPDCKTLAKDSNGNDARVTTRVSGNEPDTPAITLDPGTYYVQEISAPSGYQRDDTIHTVVIEQKKTFELTADNLVDRQGQLKIEKQSNKTGDIDLSGAVFEVYAADDTDFTEPLDRITTDENGEGYSKFLPSGSYILREVQSIAGHITPSEPFKGVDGSNVAVTDGDGIKVANNQLTTVIVKNEPYVTIRLHKVDSQKTGMSLSGAEFALYATEEDAKNDKNRLPVNGQTGGADTVTTGTDGMAVFTGLIPGTTYWYRELTAPAGYEASSEPVEITAPDQPSNYADVTQDVTNDRYGKFQVYKEGGTLDNTGVMQPLAGAEFQYYPWLTQNPGADLLAAQQNGTLKTLGTTGAGGVLTTGELEPGTYWVQETKAPDGYDLDTAAKEVTVTPGAGIDGYSAAVRVTFTDDFDSGKIQIKKVSSLDSNTTLQASFKVQQKQADGTYADYPNSQNPLILTTGANGTVTSGWLPAGDYQLIEQSVTGQYVLDGTPLPFTITAGQTNKAYFDKPIENVPMRRIGIDKFELWEISDGSSLTLRQSNVTFTIYAEDPTKNPDAQPVTTVTSASETKYTGYLAPGDYWIQETVPEDYSVDSVTTDGAAPVQVTSNVYKVTLAPDKDLVVTWNNVSDKARIELIKVDQEDRDKYLTGAEFTLYQVVDDQDPAAEEIEVNGQKLWLKVVAEKITSGTLTDAVTGAVPGGALTGLLDTGTYYLRETQPPPHDKDYFYEISQEWTGPIMVTEADDGKIVGPQIIENYWPVPVEGWKIDQGGNALEGAWVALFKTEADAQKAQAALNKDEDFFSKQLVNGELPETVLKEYNMLQAAESKDGGVLHFTNLQPGATYYALEIIGIDYYVHNLDIHKVYPKQNGDQWNLYEMTGDTKAETDPVFRLENLAYGMISVKKTLEISGETYPLNEVTFNVYAADPDDYSKPATGADGKILDPVTTITTGTGNTAAGVGISSLLKPGWYVLQEAKAPEYVDFDPDTAPYYSVYVSSDGQDKLEGENQEFTTRTDGNGTWTINCTYEKTPIANESAWGQVKIQKISADQGDNGKKLTATFKVQQKQDDGTYGDYPEGNAMTITTDPAKDYAISGFLPEGEYQLVETSVQSGYTLDSTPIKFVIEPNRITGGDNKINGVYYPLDDKDATPAPIVIENQKQGSLELTKTGDILGEKDPLSGVTFKLYRNETGDPEADCAGTALKTVTTGANGLISMTNLDAGNYWLKETSVGTANEANGFKAGMVVAVTIEAGQKTTQFYDPADLNTAKTELLNTTAYGKLQIVKQDAADQTKLSGVKFGIYSDSTASTKVGEMTTNADGAALSGLLPVGDYYLKELNTPSGYFDNTDTVYGPYTVEANQITSQKEGKDIVIENTKIQTVKVVKVDSKTNGSISGEAMKAAKFELWDKPEDQGGQVLQTVTGKETIEFVNLQPNTTYYVKEVTPPTGYTFEAGKEDYFYPVTTGNTGAAEVRISNDPLGAIRLEKKANWENPDAQHILALPLEDVTFELHRYDMSQPDGLGELVATKETDEDGEILFTGLEPGDYMLKEQVPADFVQGTQLQKITVVKGETDETYTGDNYIVNYPNKGRFTFTKFMGDGKTPLTVTSDSQRAEFALYEGDQADPGKLVDTFRVRLDGTFESADLDAGTYTIVETKAPDGYTLDSTPITFTVTAKQITNLDETEATKVINQAKGNLEFTKKGDSQNGSPVLNTAVFQLYDENKQPVGDPVTNVKNGVYRWEGLDAGTYYIRETQAPDGYSLDDTWYEAVIPANQNDPTVTYRPETAGNMNGGVLTNESDSGRILIKKADENGTGLQGAQFAVYQLEPGDVQGQQVGGIITTDENGAGVSDLLPAEDAGTRYLVKELKAPDGYSLDERYYETQKIVTVKPVQELSEIEKLGVHNNASFTNKFKTDIVMFNTEILKGITDDTADKSLLEEEFTTSFTLRDYAKGENELAASRLVVTDQDIQMQYQEQGEYKTEPTRDDAYRVNWVRVYSAYNAQTDPDLDVTVPDASKPVSAKVQYQPAADLGSDDESTWRDVPNGAIENVQSLGADGATVSIPAGLEAMAFRVVYTGVDEHFVANGIDFEVTFAQRPSDASLHEITKITNTAAYEYTFVQKDEEGRDVPVTDGRASNTVEATLPLIESIRIPVSLTVKPEGTQTTYAPNSDVTFVVTAKNESQTDNFREPILSFDLPVGTTLNDFVEGDSQFVIMRMWEDEDGNTVGTPLTPDLFSIDTVKATRVGSGGELIELEQDTQKVTMTFPDVELKPGERIVIRFSAHIDPNSQADTLWCPAFLGSSYEIPQSVENQYGVSYAPVITGDGGSFKEDEDLDEILGNGGSEYVNNYANIVVGQNSSLSIYKQVKGEYDDRYKNYSELGHTAPGGSIDYKIRVSNGSDDKAVSTRVVDILPFAGDTLTDRTDTTVTNRATDLERRPALNSVTVLSSDGQPIDSAFVRIYYCTDDTSAWTAESRSQYTAEEELPMIYTTGRNGDPWTSSAAHTWSATPPADLSTVTAIGVEVTQPLANGDYIEVQVNMTAPQYATDEIEDYYGKYISNSAMCSVVRNSNTGDTIALSDRPENQEVKCVLDLPKGAIGDYAFYDQNQNGIQDAEDLPVAGLGVRLITTRITADGTQTTTTETTTDSSGYYLFDDLECNIMLSGKEDGDPDDPSNYVGGVIYQYQVEFDMPPAGDDGVYVPTRQYEGGDTAVDSNIDRNGRSEILRLGVVSNPDTSRLEGQRDMTIDAGFVIPAALGDYVWIDLNRDGIQDPDEPGVNGVRVRLYTVDDSGKVSDAPLAETVTAAQEGKDGYYFFDNLTKGRYVVEFDITSLRNDLGLYQYGFTTANQGAGDHPETADSDAKNAVDGNDRIMRTDVITLDYQQTDLTWDAGLVYYSALGGYAYDDRNYNDVQDLGIPLTGTKVSLYRVIDNVREEQPIATAVVDENGEYLFEYLLEGEYQVLFEYPEGYQAVLPNIGGDDALDSDVFETAPDLNSGYTQTIRLPANSISLHNDGGARLYGAIGDYVWLDANKNGIQDAGEESVQNVTVYLQMREGGSSIWKKVDTTTTNEKGYYVFESLKGGPDVDCQYRVCFDLPGGSVITVPFAGTDRAADSNVQGFYLEGWGYPSDVISIGYGQRDMTIDAGIVVTSGSVGDYVWLDTNRNGIQDEEDTGLEGIRVVLEYSPSGDVSDDTQWIQAGETTTNEKGYYRFDELSEGYYRVKFQILEPYTITLVNQGDAALDSDGRYQLEDGWYAGRPFYLNEGGFDMTWDCGVVLGSGGTTAAAPGGGVSTGDRFAEAAWMLLAGVSAFGAVAFGVTLSRKRRTGKHE